jgi:alkylation response protein AidB-like acyl-CoA dehydrogenase
MDFNLSEQQAMVQDMARQFARQEMLPVLKDSERQQKPNLDLLKKAGALGLIGAHLPAEYGGGGLDYLSSALIWEQLGKVSWAQTMTTIGGGVLAGTILSRVASEEQKRKYLPPICRGEMIAAMAAVEAEAGSDAGAVQSTAVKQSDGWLINGSKNFISCGGIADLYLVMVQTDKSLGYKGLAVIALEKNTTGLSHTPVSMVGDRAGDIANLGFEDCRVPLTNLIGDIGRGLQNALIGIDTARLFTSAISIGMAQDCLDACVRYAKERHQFGRPIGSFQLVQETIAGMQANIQAIRWQVYYAADLKSKGLPHAKELSAAKWLAADLAIKVSSDAIRLHGAYGATDDFNIEHHYRDAILCTILGGTAEMHKLTIGRDLLGINAMI